MTVIPVICYKYSQGCDAVHCVCGVPVQLGPGTSILKYPGIGIDKSADCLAAR